MGQHVCRAVSEGSGEPNCRSWRRWRRETSAGRGTRYVSELFPSYNDMTSIRPELATCGPKANH